LGYSRNCANFDAEAFIKGSTALKRIAHILTLALFFCYANSSPILWSIYFAFEDEIAQQYCVNKSDKRCHGKCHIRAVDEGKPAQESDTRKLELRFPEVSEFVQGKFVLAIPRSKAICTFFLTNVSALLAGFGSEVFHPPTQA
jgi:hypothetical protein